MPFVHIYTDIFVPALARDPRFGALLERMRLTDVAAVSRWRCLSWRAASTSSHAPGRRTFPGLVLKALSVSPLAAIAIRRLSGPERWLLGCALVASTVGDVLLELKGLFVAGLGAFLAAQLCYCGAVRARVAGRGRG